MPKKTESPKPLMAVKFDFTASLNQYVIEAGALADIIRTCLQHKLIDKKVSDMVQERLDKFDAIRG